MTNIEIEFHLIISRKIFDIILTVSKFDSRQFTISVFNHVFMSHNHETKSFL